jgi:hypothetical protein
LWIKAHKQPAGDYIEAGRAIDEGIVRLRREKEGLLSASREAAQAGVVAASVQQFCATARARFEACADFDAKRAFLRDHVERIVFDHGKVTILGSLPLARYSSQLGTLAAYGCDAAHGPRAGVAH